MSEVQPAVPGAGGNNARLARIILALAALSAVAYVVLAGAGDLRDRLLLYLPIHAGLAGAMLTAWLLLRRDHRNLRWVLGAALLFRLIAALGPPALSDDVYRYVWDGQVQLHGIHPYAHAPDDPALVGLRDPGWERINHPELKTIYPPLAELFFLLLAALGAGPVGFKLALALVDFAVVLALLRLLARMGLPRDRVVLYAWNPLAVIETAGSGHLEPLGLLFVLLTVGALGAGRRRIAAVALAAAVHVKLLPALLLPGFVRRGGLAGSGVLVAALALPVAAYAIGGPAVGGGLFEYARSWEHNAFFYPAVQWTMEQLDTAARLKPWVADLQRRFPDADVSWDWLYRQVWPREVARMLVGAAVAVWALIVGLRLRPDPWRAQLLLFGAALLLAPTLHPWYVLWVLPAAAASLSWGWLLLGLTVPLAYWSSAATGDVPWAVRWVEYLPALALMALGAVRARRERGKPETGRVC